MVKIGIIGKGYIGENIKFFNNCRKDKKNISFFSTSNYFLNENDYSSKLNTLKLKHSEIRENFSKFISNKDLLINTFTIQSEEFLKYDNIKRQEIFFFFESYMSLLVEEIVKKKNICIHLSSNKINNNFDKEDANYWYVKCHNLVKKIFNKNDLEINNILIPNVFGYIEDTKKGKNLLINNIIETSLSGKKFKLINKKFFYRDILFINDLCKIFYSNKIIRINKESKIQFDIKKAQELINKDTLKIEIHKFSEIVYNIFNISGITEFNHYIAKLSSDCKNKNIINILKNIRTKSLV